MRCRGTRVQGFFSHYFCWVEPAVGEGVAVEGEEVRHAAERPHIHLPTKCEEEGEGDDDDCVGVCKRVSRLFVDDLATVSAAKCYNISSMFHAAATYRSHISGARYCAVVVRAITSCMQQLLTLGK
jgi:hypothetical protein